MGGLAVRVAHQHRTYFQEVKSNFRSSKIAYVQNQYRGFREQAEGKLQKLGTTFVRIEKSS
jgi:hypothetical protein